MGLFSREKTVSLRAYAKINLTLGVTGRRADGYHTLDSLMTTVDLADDVKVERDRDIVVTATGMTLPYRNTMRMAAEAYHALTGRGAIIHVYKHIPAEAGLGGGSADAAAVLLAMNRIYEELDQVELARIAVQVGADVPFCLKGGLCRARGIGEELEALPIGRPLDLVLCKPAEGVSTKALFTSLTLPCPQPDQVSAIRALAAGDIHLLSGSLVNSLEEPAVALVPAIGRLREALLSAGAIGARMTGSGSTVFGIFESREAAERAAEAVRTHPDCAFCTVARTI